LGSGVDLAHARTTALGASNVKRIARMEDWVAFLKDEDHAGPLVPIFALAHEHDPDPAMRP
jgi:uncharacterized protein